MTEHINYNMFPFKVDIKRKETDHHYLYVDLDEMCEWCITKIGEESQDNWCWFPAINESPRTFYFVDKRYAVEFKLRFG